MPLVTRLSSIVAGIDSIPRVLPNSYIVGSSLTTAVATVPVTSTDSAGSLYRFGFVPSGARVLDIKIANDNFSVSGTLGLYLNDQQAPNFAQFINTWTATAAYVPGNVVQYLGIIYLCATANSNSQPPSANWVTGGSTQPAVAAAIPIPNSWEIFNTALSITANSQWFSIYSPTILGTSFAATNMQLRVWELLGLTADPFYEFHLALTSTIPPTGNGNIVLRWDQVR